MAFNILDIGAISFSGALITNDNIQQTINAFQAITVNFGGEVIYDTGNFYDITTPNRLTIPASGVSRVKLYGEIEWRSDLTGRGTLRPRINGGPFSIGSNGIDINIENVMVSGDPSTKAYLPPFIIDVSPGDFFELQVVQTGVGSNAITQSLFGIEVIDT